jgi:hypothetical protein
MEWSAQEISAYMAQLTKEFGSKAIEYGEKMASEGMRPSLRPLALVG